MSEAHARDLQLARRILAGDEQAVDGFFCRYFPALVRFALPRVDHRLDDAEDVAQSTICAALSRLATYRGESALFTWLCTFCRHEVSDLQDRRRRRPAPVDLAQEGPQIREALERLQSPDPGPEATLRREDAVRRVHATLDRLPRQYGDVLEWKYVEGLPVKSIAERLGLGLKAAESLLTRARQAFREQFPDDARPSPAPRVSAPKGSR